jgi:hypothetical protein
MTRNPTRKALAAARAEADQDNAAYDAIAADNDATLREQEQSDLDALQADEGQEPDQAEPIARRSVVPLAWQRVYAKNVLKGTCDDGIAKRLADVTKGNDGKCSRELLYSIANANGINAEGRWGHRNVGMVRMNLGNVLRGMVKRGNEIYI